MALLGAPVRAETPAPIPVATTPSGDGSLAAVKDTRPCPNAADPTRFAHPLARTARKLAAGAPIKIVAIGSSSTAGAGASSPSAAYPSRLGAELARRFPGQSITVINRGVNGEEAGDMVARLETGVIAEEPDLVLWQVGTNSLLRDTATELTTSKILEGIKRIKRAGADLILVDPQFAPKVLAKADAEAMVARLAAIAKAEDIELFQRFAMMRHWREVDNIGFETFITPDGLHQNDWGYACWAKAMAADIAEAAARPTTTAAARPARR